MDLRSLAIEGPILGISSSWDASDGFFAFIVFVIFLFREQFVSNVKNPGIGNDFQFPSLFEK